MSNQHFTKRILGIIAIGLLVVLPVRIPDACVFVPEDYAYSFITPSLVDTMSIYAPYSLSFDKFQFPFFKEDHQLEDNIQEWIERYCESPDRSDVFQLVYKTSISELEELKAATINPNLPLPIDLRKNVFAEQNQISGCTDVVNYLIFAKACEPHVVASKDPWKQEKKDLDAIHDLMKEGGQLFRESDSHFIRLRIAYQVIRLAHYAKEYKKVLELRDYFLPKINQKVPSIIKWWILGHVAGAEQSLGKKAMSAYHFAQVFHNAPSKRTSAFRSFSIKNDEQWGEAILLCKSNKEKANLYAIRAAQGRSQLLSEIEAIYRLDPTHSSLEPLMIKATKQMEAIFLGSEFSQNKTKKTPTKSQKKRLKSLIKLIDKAVEEKKINHPVVWKIAKGYNLVLQGNWPEAELVFKDLETTNVALSKQIDIIKTVIEIKSYQHADTETESNIYNMMLDNEVYQRNPSIQEYTKQRLSYLYGIDSLPGKAALLKYGKDDLKMAYDLSILDDLIKVTEKEMPSRLEKMLTTLPNGTSIRSQILEIKATLLLSQGRIEAAKEVYSLVPRGERSDKKYSPFVEDIRDCVFCPVTDTTAYTKSEVIDKLIEYDYRARADIENGPEYFFLLGNAWYNMSYFGPAWQMTDYFRSGANWHFAYEGVYPTHMGPFGNKENHNLSKSKQYFSKALELSKDTELQARAAFMLARIDQKDWFLSENCKYSGRDNLIPKLPSSRMVYYNLLMKEYQKTDFYQELIEECSYFAAYVR